MNVTTLVGPTSSAVLPPMASDGSATFAVGDSYQTGVRMRQPEHLGSLPGGLRAPYGAGSSAEGRQVKTDALDGLIAQRELALQSLQRRLFELEKNEILRNELQAPFLNAVRNCKDITVTNLDNCFDLAFSEFSATHPQIHWRILAEVFKPSYVSEASLAFAEVRCD